MVILFLGIVLLIYGHFMIDEIFKLHIAQFYDASSFLGILITMLLSAITYVMLLLFIAKIKTNDDSEQTLTFAYLLKNEKLTIGILLGLIAALIFFSPGSININLKGQHLKIVFLLYFSFMSLAIIYNSIRKVLISDVLFLLVNIIFYLLHLLIVLLNCPLKL